ncbi:MAG TPA: hypothetical protein VM101_07635 [Flavitalea sp.]|nr:hypothetical protein [Flavitalea sp.]
MENKFYHTDFEELIKEKVDQYKMYPSDRVWKRIDRAIRSRRKWYWSGFVLLLSGISYLAVNELMSPAALIPVRKNITSQPQQPEVTPQQLNPLANSVIKNEAPSLPSGDDIISDFSVEDNGNVTAAFEIPLRLIPGTGNVDRYDKASVLISGLAPLNKHEQYNFELSWPNRDDNVLTPADQQVPQQSGNVILHPLEQPAEKVKINWLVENASFRIPEGKTKRISWQLAFSPTVNYRKLSGTRMAKNYIATSTNIPLALRLDGNIGNLVNHKPALGFELGTHGHMKLNNRFTLKGGLQFNYSKYDIRAFSIPAEFTTIALNSQTGNSTLVSVSDIRNFGGNAPEDLKNQYFQVAVPVGLEFRIFGNERLQLNIAGTIQPAYLINSNTYLITTDFKNYAKEPSLVRKWNVNTGAEAFIAYERGGVKWQVGPQFRYQLLSSYKKEYPIKEYLMEYGIKVGITKTIR